MGNTFEKCWGAEDTNEEKIEGAPEAANATKAPEKEEKPAQPEKKEKKEEPAPAKAAE